MYVSAKYAVAAMHVFRGIYPGVTYYGNPGIHYPKLTKLDLEDYFRQIYSDSSIPHHFIHLTSDTYFDTNCERIVVEVKDSVIDVIPKHVNVQNNQFPVDSDYITTYEQIRARTLSMYHCNVYSNAGMEVRKIIHSKTSKLKSIDKFDTPYQRVDFYQVPINDVIEILYAAHDNGFDKLAALKT